MYRGILGMWSFDLNILGAYVKKILLRMGFDGVLTIILVVDSCTCKLQIHDATNNKWDRRILLTKEEVGGELIQIQT